MGAAGVSAGDLRARRVLVSGRVQGVGFRAATAERARRLGLHGYAANLSDGRVEILFRGRADAVQALLEWLAEGPPPARVREVVSTEAPHDAADWPPHFQIR